MGIGVETSRLGRQTAELAASAVDDDARQDEDHAGDAEKVRSVLEAEAVVPAVLAGGQVHDCVECSGRQHQQQPDAADGRQVMGIPDQLSHRLYR
jgi:hypothetical protein